MPTKYDFKKEWEVTKKQLVKFSKEAAIVAKKGEDELIKFTRRSKLHIDSTSLTLKKEHLYHLIGKEYVKQLGAEKESPKLIKLIQDLEKAESQRKEVREKIKKSGNKT